MRRGSSGKLGERELTRGQRIDAIAHLLVLGAITPVSGSADGEDRVENDVRGDRDEKREKRSSP